MSSSLLITLNSKTNVFFPNSEIHGIIHFTTTNNSSTVKQINVSIIGCARIYFEETRSYGEMVDDIPFKAEQYYMNYNTVLWENFNYHKLSNGVSHQFPFKFIIPSNALSSISEKYGEIQYYVKAWVEFWGSNKDLIEYYGFSVCSIIDLNLDQKLTLPVYTSVTDNTIFAVVHPLVVTMCLPKSGYVCGETIPLKIDLSNQRYMKIMLIEYGIALKCSYTGSCKAVKWLRKAETKNKESSLNVVTNSVEPPTSNSAIYNILIPPFSPSSSECPFLKLQYFVFVKVHTDELFKAGPSTSIPITIGTVPIMDEPTTPATKLLETADFIEGETRSKIKNKYFNKNKEGPIEFQPKFAYYSNMSLIEKL